MQNVAVSGLPLASTKLESASSEDHAPGSKAVRPAVPPAPEVLLWN
jgi:hypothetical protein